MKLCDRAVIEEEEEEGLEDLKADLDTSKKTPAFAFKAVAVAELGGWLGLLVVSFTSNPDSL